VYEFYEGGMSISQPDDPMVVKIAGVEVDLNRQALLYDRRQRAVYHGARRNRTG